MILSPPCFIFDASPTRICTYAAYYQDTADATTYTFSACDIGAESTDRRVIVAVHQGAASNRTLSSVTIAGVSATEITTDTSSRSGVVFVIAAVPTGTTGDIVVTWSGACTNCGVGIWAAVGLSSGTPVSAVRNASTTAPSSGSMATTVGGFVIAAATARLNGLCLSSWSGVTEKYDGTVDTGNVDWAHFSGGHTTTDGSMITITDTFSATADFGAAAFVAF